MYYLKTIKENILHSLPVIILYFFSFYNIEELRQVGKINVFSFNLQMILIYFYTLKFPDYLGVGHIFLAGFISDTVIGIPLGATSLSYLSLSVFTTYLRNSTIRSVMTAEWFTFIPALFFSNFIYLIIVNNFWKHLNPDAWLVIFLIGGTIIGIGINVSQKIFPDELKPIATSIYRELKMTISKKEVQEAITDSIREYLKK